MNKATKLAPPAPISEADRRLYAAAPMPKRTKDGKPLGGDISPEWIQHNAPAHLRVTRKQTSSHVALAGIVEERRGSRALGNAQADASATARIRGGVEWKDYRRTEREHGLRSDALKLRTMRDAWAQGPLTAEERLAYTRVDLDAPDAPGKAPAPETAEVSALRVLADGLADSAEALRHANEERARRLGIAI